MPSLYRSNTSLSFASCPQAIGIHGHESGSHVVHSPLDEELAFAWKSLATLSAIYAFYLLETIMGWWSVSIWLKGVWVYHRAENLIDYYNINC